MLQQAGRVDGGGMGPGKRGWRCFPGRQVSVNVRQLPHAAWVAPIDWVAQMPQSARQPRRRFPPVRTDSSRHVATEIRRYVERQGLKPGDRIGTEQELAA